MDPEGLMAALKYSDKPPVVLTLGEKKIEFREIIVTYGSFRFLTSAVHGKNLAKKILVQSSYRGPYLILFQPGSIPQVTGEALIRHLHDSGCDPVLWRGDMENEEDTCYRIHPSTVVNPSKFSYEKYFSPKNP